MATAQRFPESRHGLEVVIQPLRAFTHNKLVGAALLMLATILALAWANSPWAESYQHLLHAPVSLNAGPFHLEKSAIHWVNDGMMAFFFFTVGLEIKREMLIGDLSTVRQATLPFAAAVGGMVVPAALYFAVNPTGDGASGWGVPMATDIAFALGVLALLGGRVPSSLTTFLTALAIVDDIGGILVIAFFYSDGLSLWVLGLAAVLLVVSAGANRLNVRHPIFYFIIGVSVWLCFLQSGVHATLAAVLMAFTIPARTRINRERLVTRMTLLVDQFRRQGLDDGKEMLSHEQEELLECMGETVDRASAPLQRLEELHMPVVTFIVLPLFALGNAGVHLRSGVVEQLLHPVSLGIVLGLVVGKQLGITGAAFLAVKLGLADLPKGVTWRALHGVSVLGGIGFTMALFIGGLAFSAPELDDVVKVGILAASALSAVLGLGLVVLATKDPDDELDVPESSGEHPKAEA